MGGARHATASASSPVRQFCTNRGEDETWRLPLWFGDRSGASPFDTYWQLLENRSTERSPRSGQPFVEKALGDAGTGLTTVTVHPP